MKPAVLAVILAIISYSILNIGLVLKKKGAASLQAIESQSLWQNIKNFTSCKTWLFGFLLTVMQWFILMVAVNLGSLSLVAPMMGVGMSVLVIFSWLYLKESISFLEIIGIIAIIGAVVALKLSDPDKPPSYSLDDINKSFRDVGSIVFLVILVILITTLIVATYDRKFPRAGALIAIASGIANAFATIFAKGTIGGIDMQNFFSSFGNSLGKWQWWLYLFLMNVGYLVAFTTQQMAFQKGKSVVVSPVYATMSLLTQVSAGIFVFNEWNHFEVWRIITKIIAIAVILAGVALLSIFAAKTQISKTKVPSERETEATLERGIAKAMVCLEMDLLR